MLVGIFDSILSGRHTAIMQGYTACKHALNAGHTLLQAAFAHVASGARTAKRVVAISKGEAENSEDVEFKSKLDGASNAVTQGLFSTYCGPGGRVPLQ